MRLVDEVTLKAAGSVCGLHYNDHNPSSGQFCEIFRVTYLILVREVKENTLLKFILQMLKKQDLKEQ